MVIEVRVFNVSIMIRAAAMPAMPGRSKGLLPKQGMTTNYEISVRSDSGCCTKLMLVRLRMVSCLDRGPLLCWYVPFLQSRLSRPGRLSVLLFGRSHCNRPRVVESLPLLSNILLKVADKWISFHPCMLSALFFGLLVPQSLNPMTFSRRRA